jgi:urease accessory protein
MSFLFVIAAAGAIGIAGIPVQIVEAGIGLSIVVLGLMIAFQTEPPTLVAMAIVGFFALFHGYAHGSEMPNGLAGLSFATGFLIATALLLSAGAGLGLLLQRRSLSRRLIQAGGGATALVGIAVLTSVF